MEPIGRLRREDAEVDRLSVGQAPGRIEPGEPQEVVDEPVHPLALAVDPPERAPVPLGLPIPAQGERRLRLDDRQRRAQLVDGVGGELELAATGELDRGGDPPADGDGAEEDDHEEDRGDDHLGEDDGRAGLGHRVETLGDDDVEVVGLGSGDPHVDAADRWP